MKTKKEVGSRVVTSTFTRKYRKELLKYAKSIEEATNDIKIKDFSTKAEASKKAASLANNITDYEHS